ncbi:acyltransferase family protein [Diaminobutyricimonas sp. TR449]|uniref:acyltransferase family protein n=1 Tax=Diaminobutyricimonas sp. TR449 TaxID=2708076 RepID=UPI001FBB5E38|nr:acyltransferase family protein [Diaminobutyricimonas sp. TR449]
MSTSSKSAFRSDIQGLRAIAVLLVLVYHAGATFLPGGYVGVDIFFVVSGFLITGGLLRSLERDGRINFGDFYAKRIRRILPASIVVLVLTLAAAFIWVPPLQLQTVLRDAMATALYVPNMWFAMEDTDYLAETAPSMFQHYWSLGIEEQFYLFWPAILALGFVLVRKSRTGLLVLLTLLVVGSFVYCLWLMGQSQPWAFFSLPSRAWELGIGGLLAFVLAGSHRWLQGIPAALLGWVGLAALLGAAVFYDAGTVFPGLSALLPVLGTVAVIIGCTSANRFSPNGLLSLKPMQWFGMISYSLYLVHWPLLVIPQAAVGLGNPLLPIDKALLALVAIPLAHIVYTFVENPARRAEFWAGHKPRRSLAIGGLASVTVLALTAGTLVLTQNTQLGSGRDAETVAAGSAASVVGTEYVPDNLQPTLQEAEDDNPSIYAAGCHGDFSSTDPSGCQIGDNPDAPVVALFGDSHAASWYPALETLAQAGQIRLDSNTKSSCPSVSLQLLRDGSEYTSCHEWRDGVIERLNATPPDLVLLANYGHADLVGGDDNFAEDWKTGLQTTLEALPVESTTAVISDIPDMGTTPAICLSNNLDDALECARPAVEAINKEIRAAEQEAAGDKYLDFIPYFCDHESCPAVIGNTLVYRDSHHMTATFSATLGEPLGEKITELLAR